MSLEARKIFAQNIVKYRKNLNLTQKRVAELINMPLSTYTHLEAGRIPYTIIDYIDPLLNVFGISHSQLFGKEVQENEELLVAINKTIEFAKEARSKLI